LFSLEAWGSKILDSVERQERLLAETLGASPPSHFPAQQPRQLPSYHQQLPPIDAEDTELISRNDALKTPITGSDMILGWPIFPQEKPISTFPPAAFEEKPDRFQAGWFAYFKLTYKPILM
jgi:hypothetical protein